MPQFPIPESFAKFEDYVNNFSEDDLKAELTNYDKLGG